MLSQVKISTGTAEAVAAVAAALTAIGVGIRKIVTRKRKGSAEYVTRAEFHEGMEATRNRIGAGYLAVTERLDGNHREVLGALERLGARTEERLDRLEAGLARVDERTKF
jgi:hypothetical protein